MNNLLKLMKNLFWKIKLSSPPNKVFEMWTTDEGREKFWAAKSVKSDSSFTLTFEDGNEDEFLVISDKKYVFEFIYYRTIVTVSFIDDGQGGTELLLNNKNIPPAEYEDFSHRWIILLLEFKAACDFDIDLRNHDIYSGFSEGYIDF